MVKRYAAWVSDHSPNFQQKEYLEERGYTVCLIRSPKPTRWQNAHQIYSYMMKNCNPDIIIMVLPSQTLGGQFIDLCKEIPIYSADMVIKNGVWTWTGAWSRIVGTRYLKSKEDIPYIEKLS